MTDEVAKRTLLGKIWFIALIIGIFLAGWFTHTAFSPSGKESSAKQAKVIWTCPMHPQITSDKPGECPICYMSLVKREEANAPSDENQTAAAHEAGVYINSRRQQLIGVKKETVQERDLTKQIDTVGKVANLLDLYVAQQDYLLAVRYRQVSQKTGADAGRQDLVDVAKSKLLTLGMSLSQIRQIEQTGKPETSLYLPENEQVWVSITIYEQDAEFVKEGLPVEVEAIAYPGKMLTGKIVSISPILDAMTRMLQVRALVDNPGNLLRMEMSVNVRIQIPLGKKTAVPQDAIMHTGTRNLVYIVRDEGYFVGRDVELGAKAQGFYEVRKGLQAGDVVVTSGNFLIDSESKLNAALNRIADSNEKP